MFTLNKKQNEEIDTSVCYLNTPQRDLLVIDDVKLTAQNIWKNKDYWIQKVFEYYRNRGFPYPQMTEEEILAEVQKLKNKDPNECLTKKGELKNSSSLCTDITRYINNNCYWKCSGGKTPSIYDAFMNDETLLKVLKNRMGYAKESHDFEANGITYKAGTHYLFDMSDKQLFQGFRSSRIGFSVSSFKPIVAKYLIQRYCEGKNVLDPSIGWSARYLAAYSLNKNYFGIDPAPVAKNTEKLARFLKDSDSQFITSGSEHKEAYKTFPGIDYTIVCPPYFDLETYVGEKDQSIETHSDYSSWLKYYWKPTVENCFNKMKKSTKFTLIMIEQFSKYSLLNDMTKIVEDAGFEYLETIPYKTTRSHLNKKAGITKDSEKCVTFIKA